MIGGDEAAVLFKDFAWQEWRDKYGCKPPWGPKDWANLQTALSRFDDPAAAWDAWRAYLRNEERFFEGHSPSKFLLELGRFASRTPAKPKPRKQEDVELVAKLTRMARISAEVDRDPSIPESERKNEYKRRWGMEA